MTLSELQNRYKEIIAATFQNRLLDALRALMDIKQEIHSSDIHTRCNSISDTYHNMLKFSFEMAPDPERHKIHLKLQQSILELADDIKDQWISDNNLFERKTYELRILHSELDYLQEKEKIVERLSLAYVDKENTISNERLEDARREQDKLTGSLFYYLWLKNRYKENEKDLLWELIKSGSIDLSTKSLLVSAITLSLLRHFDRRKLILLFDFAQLDEPQVRQRGLIGLFIGILIYQKRILLYPEILDRLRSVPDNKLFQERLLAVLIQFIRSTETEKITKKIQDEIVPEVLKIRSELEEKLNLEDILSKKNFDEKNPEWEDFFKDSPDVYQKLEQFSKMQIEGADVFMGAFAMLKHFNFFKELANWFIPFHSRNSAVLDAFEGMKENMDVPAFIEGLEHSTVMCNSDKYSFCLNVQHMPEQQRKMMVDLFNLEMKSMNELAEDEFKMNAELKNKAINTQYFQDLYRFFTLHPNKKEYPDIFKMQPDIFNSEIFHIIFEDEKSIKSLAEFYFAQDQYGEALQLYKWLSKKESSFELFEKIGFCFQKLGDYTRAIESYKQAELFDKNKLWLQKKLGYCYRKIGQYQKAIDFYKEISESEPNDHNNLAYLGQLYIDIEDFEEALKYYYKVEYQQPDNSKVFRPIGWCSFVLGKYETAIKYFSKVTANKPLKIDFLNIGHAYWASGKTTMALESYREAVKRSGGDEIWFRDTFRKDSKYLKKTGIDDFDVTLMIDYVLMGDWQLD